MESLHADVLEQLPGHVAVPAYPAAQVGIAHIGVGNFHRAHQAMYLDRLLQQDPETPWAICGIGMLEQDRVLAEVFAQQDHLYSLSLFHPDGAIESRIVGSIREFLLTPDDPERVVTRLTDPAIRIVSLTITESGYVEDPANNRSAAEDPEVAADVARNLESPRSTFGLLAAALRRRREAGTPPFTVMTCDNIQNNGHVARASVVAVAELVDPELAQWIFDNVDFPSTMVDRITPRPTPEQLVAVEAHLGLRDGAAVVAEPFEQWVLEDKFRHGRPELEKAGAVFVDDIDQYESMKLRLLNGAHQVLAYVGAVHGHTYVHEAMRDERVTAWLDLYWYDLALPTVDLPAGVSGADYISILGDRFSNPEIADTLERLGVDSSDRLAKFVLPVLLDAEPTPAAHTIAAGILASWVKVAASTQSALMLPGIAREIRAAAQQAADDSEAVLKAATWLHPALKDTALKQAVVETIQRIMREDPVAVLDALRSTVGDGGSSSRA